MGMYLDFKETIAARPIKYAMDKPSENSNWMSRNMLITGSHGYVIFRLTLLRFLVARNQRLNSLMAIGSGLPNGELGIGPHLHHKFQDYN